LEALDITAVRIALQFVEGLQDAEPIFLRKPFETFSRRAGYE